MSTHYTALIVDDEPDILELLELTLGRMDITCQRAETYQQALTLLQQHTFNLCLTDMKLPDGTGLDLVKHIQQHHPQLPVAVITAHGNMEAAITALKDGAFDFVSKPIDLKTLRNLITTSLNISDTTSPPQKTPPQKNTLLGDSEPMQAIRATINKLARSQAPVYISGESGSGKELVARLIHANGPRAAKPFVAVNCGAIPEQLMESELFGHVKGSFTGANSDKMGLFQAAEGGTLFLDEVADLPLHMQVKLLRAIQEKCIRPIGGHKEISVDIRILSATHKDLSKLVEEASFRQDLFYRINVIQLSVPSLRERKEDIIPLTHFFLTKFTQQNQLPEHSLATETQQALQQYSFPGNVRELENIIERALTLCESNEIKVDDLMLPTSAPNNDTSPTAITNQQDDALEPYIQNQERAAIIKALEQTRYNKTAAAKLLGISFRALRYRIKKFGIE